MFKFYILVYIFLMSSNTEVKITKLAAKGSIIGNKGNYWKGNLISNTIPNNSSNKHKFACDLETGNVER